MSLSVTVVPVTPYQQNCSIIKCETTGLAAVVDENDGLLCCCPYAHACSGCVCAMELNATAHDVDAAPKLSSFLAKET